MTYIKRKKKRKGESKRERKRKIDGGREIRKERA